MLQCDECLLKGLDESTLKAHLVGKRHLKNLRKNEKRKALENSIFVTSLPRRTTERKIIEFFNTFGKIVDHKCTPTYAIIEFESKESIDKVLSNKICLEYKELRIERRAFNNIAQEKNAESDNSAKYASPLSLDQLDYIVKADSSFDEQFKCLLDAIQLCDTDLRNRYDPICTDLDRIFSGIFPMCRTYKFGSTQTGLAFKESDLDVYLDIGPGNPLTMESIFKAVKNIMFKKRTIFHNIIPIRHAKTPIIKFCYAPTNVHCDISFKYGFGVWNSSIIHNCLSLDVRLKPLMMFIKYWAKYMQIAGTGKISSYALIMLIIFFLQQPSVGIIPPFTELRKKCQPVIINGWQINFDSNPDLPVITNTKTIPELLKEFFTFYGNFNFKSNVICPLNGTVIPEKDFVESIENLPPCMKNYTNFISLKDPTTLLHVTTPICVQDPIELNRNITSCTSERTLNCFQLNCQMGAEICASTEKNNYKNLLHTLFMNSVKPQKPFAVELDFIFDLPKQITANTSDFDPILVQKNWYFTMCNIIKDFFEKVMLMEVEVLCIDKEAKQQKVETLSDVHTKDHCKLILACRGNKCVWRNRQMHAVNILDPSLSNLDKEIMTSNKLMAALAEEGEHNLVNLEFVCTLKKILNTVFITLKLENNGTNKELIKECYKFVKKTIPKTVNTTLLHMKQYKKHY